MKFSFYKKPRRLFQSADITLRYEWPLYGRLGRGFYTYFTCKPEFEEEMQRIFASMTNIARKRNSKVPFAMSARLHRELERDYVVCVGGEIDFPQFHPKECREAGIVRTLDGSFWFAED